MNWYLANKLLHYQKDDRGVRQDAEREARDLIQRLRERPRLKDLTINPLLLTMIANVHNYRGTLPEKRIELYSEICDVLLGHWQRAKGVGDTLTVAQKRVVLQPLAEAMMIRKTRALPCSDALDVMREHLLQIGISEQDVSMFLGNVRDRSGLLQEQEPDMWGFAHLTFQEYLCATHWKDSGKASSGTSKQWQRFIEDSWWHETLRLYAAQCNASSLIQACLERNTDAALQLASNLTEEALKIDGSLRDAVKNARKLPRIRLRSSPQRIAAEKAEEAFRVKGDGIYLKPLEYIRNEYEGRGDVVLDRATGLIWQQSGSAKWLSYTEAQKYVEALNRQKFAGYTDWRLPTIPELLSLVEPEKGSNGLYIDPIFDPEQRWCWSADTVAGSSGSAWRVGFLIGGVGWGFFQDDYYVRCVRS